MDVEEYLPLTETTFFILLAIASDASHGYAIMKKVEELSAGRVALSTGTLYGGLKRMLEQGWLERVRGPMPDASGRERKSYALTDLGQEIIDAETARLRQLVTAARLCTQEATAGAE
jgi:DNA-binding PadR family transcriptional regulator